MRILFVLFLALALMAAMTLFPEIARQPLRIEAFGWLFETKQGAFIVVLFLLLTVLWVLRRLLSAILAGPGHLWQTLRVGGKKRREQRLREGLAAWIDMRGDLGVKAFRKSRHIVPDWMLALLKLLPVSAKDQLLTSSDDDPLLIALTARLVTDPNMVSTVDTATQKAHLEAWLQAHPGAPLALTRMANLAEAEHDWKALIRLLEEVWKRGHQSGVGLKDRLAKAYVAYAAEQPSQCQELLRKAHRLTPGHPKVLLSLGLSYADHNDTQAAQKLWLNHLQKTEDWDIAEALFNLLQADPLKATQELEQRRMHYNHSLTWLHARLAHKAGLDGIAQEMIESLLQESQSPQAWHTRGDWHVEAGEWEAATKCYQHVIGHPESNRE